MTRAVQPCGTDAAYRRHLRRRDVACTPCTRAHAAVNRRGQHRRGVPSMGPLVDAAPVREHVLRLRADGLGRKQLARASGVSPELLFRLLNGQPHRGLGPTQRMRMDRALAILAIRPRLKYLGTRIDVDGTGTRRRLQALTCLGWTQVRLARELGMQQRRLNQLVHQDRVGAGNALAIRNLYDRLWETPPPVKNRNEREGARRARVRAEDAGWAPPMAWDEDTIDDPAARPDFGARVRSAFEVAGWEWVRVAGVTRPQFARSHGVTEDAVDTALRRAARRAAPEQMAEVAS